jgi:hypothetical protein
MSKKCPSGGIGRRSSTRTPLWLRLLQQLLELVDDHLGELAAGVIAMRLRAGIVQFHLIGEKADGPAPVCIQIGWSSSGQSSKCV